MSSIRQQFFIEKSKKLLQHERSQKENTGENAGKENQIGKKTYFSSVLTQKRVNADDSNDQLRPRLQELSVAPVSDKAFQKPRFNVYEDLKVAENSKSKNLTPKETNAFKYFQDHELMTYYEEELGFRLDYLNDYIDYQIDVDERKRLSTNFFKLKITVDQYRLTIKYIIKCVAYKTYSSYLTYQAVKIFEHYINAVKKVRISEMQMAATCALWIALKKHGVSHVVPQASEFLNGLFIYNQEPDIKAFSEFEKKMLMVLEFDICYADPFTMLALSIIMICDKQDLDSDKVKSLYYFGCFFLDLSLLHEKTCFIPVVNLVLVIVETVLCLFKSSNSDLKNPQWSYWRNEILSNNPAFVKYCLSDMETREIRINLLKATLLTKDRETDFRIVFKKYNMKRYGLVSNEILSKVERLYYYNVFDSVL